MRSYGTTEKNKDNEQITVSAQKNAIFSSQRFYGLEKEFREETQHYALKKSQCFYHSTSIMKKRTTRNGNKVEHHYFRLEDKTKPTNKQK